MEQNTSFAQTLSQEIELGQAEIKSEEKEELP